MSSTKIDSDELIIQNAIDLWSTANFLSEAGAAFWNGAARDGFFSVATHTLSGSIPRGSITFIGKGIKGVIDHFTGPHNEIIETAVEGGILYGLRALVTDPETVPLKLISGPINNLGYYYADKLLPNASFPGIPIEAAETNNEWGLGHFLVGGLTGTLFAYGSHLKLGGTIVPGISIPLKTALLNGITTGAEVSNLYTVFKIANYITDANNYDGYTLKEPVFTSFSEAAGAFFDTLALSFCPIPFLAKSVMAAVTAKAVLHYFPATTIKQAQKVVPAHIQKTNLNDDIEFGDDDIDMVTFNSNDAPQEAIPNTSPKKPTGETPHDSREL